MALGFGASAFGFICLVKRLQIPLISGLGRLSFSLYIISKPIIVFFNFFVPPYILFAFFSLGSFSSVLGYSIPVVHIYYSVFM